MNQARNRAPCHAQSTLRRLSAFLLLAIACASSAQILARPGYKGISANAEPWWTSAIFYHETRPLDAKALAARLDALRALHVDALIVPAPELPPPGSNAAMPDLDDFDDLLGQASTRGIRVLLDLEAPNASAGLSGLARFWLNRGVAGLHVLSPPGASPEATQAVVDSLRKLAVAAVGQRIILSDLDVASAESPAASPRRTVHYGPQTSRPVSPQMQIDTRPASLPGFDAGSLRPILTQAVAQPNLLLALRAPASAPLSQAVAAITLITQPASLIDSSAKLMLQSSPEQTNPAQLKGEDEPAKSATPPPHPPQAPSGTYAPYVPYVPPLRPHTALAKPLPEDPLTIWYGQLASLHHDKPAFHSGTTTFLDFDAQNALVWIRQPMSRASHPPAPVVVICNLSSSPLQLALADAIKRLNLHGFFLRTLLRTDRAMGAQNINSINVPAHGVYIGELRR
ncbi:MAG: alpha-amylase family protein [Acidobacteriota bacterium]|nr:alpha-amylase family protein [Acidobacteriota bacterium]